MPSTFTFEEAQEEQPKTFSFEEALGEPAAPDLSKIKLSPYEQAIDANRGMRPESGMEPGTEFTSAVGEAMIRDPLGTLFTPAVEIPRIEGKTTLGKIAAAPVNVASGLIQGVESLGGLLTLPFGGPLVKGVFGGLAAKSAGEQLGQASVTGDVQQAAEGVLGAGVAPFIALHGSLPVRAPGAPVSFETGRVLPPPAQRGVPTSIGTEATPGMAEHTQNAMLDVGRRAGQVVQPVTERAEVAQPAPQAPEKPAEVGQSAAQPKSIDISKLSESEYGKLISGERPVSAATELDDGTILEAAAHPLIQIPKGRTIKSEGFVTNKRRYVDRDEAAMLTGGDYWKGVQSGQQSGAAESVLTPPEEPSPVQWKEFYRSKVEPTPPSVEPKPSPDPTTVGEEKQGGAKKPWQMTRSEFDSSDFYQHTILRPESHTVGPEGWKSGIGPNVIPATTGKPGNVIERNYGTKAGTKAYPVPSNAIRLTPNGAKIKEGWVPGDPVPIRYDYQPLHEAIVEQAIREGKPVPPEVLADYPDLKPEKPAAVVQVEPEAETKSVTAAETAAKEPWKMTKQEYENGPPVQEGFTRLWRGEDKNPIEKPTGLEGRWFSTSREVADFFAGISPSTKPTHLVYVDVPTADLPKYDANNLPEKDRPPIPDEQAYVLPESLASTKRHWVDKHNDGHGDLVATALEQGKPVPPEVLADYPDLKPTPPPEPKPAPAAVEVVVKTKPAETPTPTVAPAGEKGKGVSIPVWKVSYTDLETRAAKRPFFKHTAEVEAPTRKEAIEMVQRYHGNPSKWGEWRASKAPEGTKPMSMFRHIPEEPTPPPAAAAKVQAEVEKVAATEGQRPAKEVKAELAKRIQDELDSLPAPSPDLNIQQVGPRTTRGRKTLEYVAFPGDRITIEEIGSNNWTVYGSDFYTPPGTKQPIIIRQTIGSGMDLKSAKKLAESTLRDNGGNFPWNPDKPVSTGYKEIKVDWSHFTGKTGKPKTVTIDIPGDGTFTISKTRFALEEMQKRVKSLATKENPPGVPSAEVPEEQRQIDISAKKASDYYGSDIKAAQAIRSQLERGDFDPEQVKFSKAVAEQLESRAQEVKRDLRQKISNAQNEIGRLREFFEQTEDLKRQSGRPLTASQSRDLASKQEIFKQRQKDLKEYQDKLASLEPQPTPSAPMEGPGSPSRTQGPDVTGAQMQQLSEAFRQINAQKVPLLQRIKEAFNFGQKRELSENLIARTLSALKTSGDYLIDTWKGQGDVDPILKAKGELSAELETRGWRLRQAMKDMRRAVPSKAVREAISKYVDAGGDIETLRRSAEEVPATRRAAYLRALQLTSEEKIVAGHIQSYFESRLQEAIDAGVLSDGIEDYIHRIYPKDTQWRRGVINAVQNSLLDTRSPGLARKRVFELDAEAEKAGFMPVSDFIPRILDYEASLSKVIASRKAVQRFTEIRMPDGRPMLDAAGIGTPLENQQGIREATLIRPSFKPGQAQYDEHGNPTRNNRKDYQSRDYPALKRWRWASNDSEGNPIFVQGDVLIHPDAVHRIDALLEPSKVRKYAAARAALTVGSVFKQTMLDFSGFHQVQIAIHGLEHKVNPFHLVKDVDTNDPNVQGLLRGGMTLGGTHVSGLYQEGLVGRSLSRQIPGLGELMQSYHDWLFQNFIPRVKTTMALHALDRNRARFARDLESGRMTEAALFHQTAKEANAAFGELNYIMLERSKTAQDMARLVLLAPDFLEARGRFALQAGTRLGGEQRMALLLGALTLYTTARLMNKALNDEWHFEPENMFSVIHNGKAYSIRTVQGDILHALTSPVKFWLHRLNPTLTRPLFELMSGRDEFGRKRDFWQVMGDTISNAVPISMRNSREQSIWTSLLNAFGGSVRRDSDVARLYRYADEWKQKNNVRTEPGEFIYDPSKDIYRPLKLALLDGDTAAAATEYRKLISSKVVTPDQALKHFQTYAKTPFSGSKINEPKFFKSLTADQQHAYQGAKQEKERILKEFLRARAIAK